MAKRFEITFVEDRETVRWDTPMKGLAFLHAKRHAANGIPVTITLLTSVPEKKGDRKIGRWWWKAEKTWSLYPDGSARTRSLSD